MKTTYTIKIETDQTTGCVDMGRLLGAIGDAFHFEGLPPQGLTEHEGDPEQYSGISKWSINREQL